MKRRGKVDKKWGKRELEVRDGKKKRKV